MRTMLAAGAFLLALTGAALAGPDSSYDASKPPAVTYGKPHALAPGVSARSVSIASPTGHAIAGEIIAGHAKGLHPAILFVHWLGDPKTTNHTEFEPDAVALAKKGATALLIDAMWAKPDWFDHMGVDAKADYDESVAQVIDLRVALHALLAQPQVDPARVAYVGHDFGAMFGALMAGVEPAPQYYVLMAGTATLQEWYLLEHKAKDEAAYTGIIAPLDILASLKASKAKGYLLQFAAHDHYIPLDRAQRLADATPLPKGVFWYDTGHALAVPDAFADRQAWLSEKLFGK